MKQNVLDMIQAHADEERTQELEKKIVKFRSVVKSKSNLLRGKG